MNAGRSDIFVFSKYHFPHEPVAVLWLHLQYYYDAAVAMAPFN
jgi:hypothetical protein